MKYEIEKLRKDACISTDKEFEANYPGVKREAIYIMTDEELEKVVAGFLGSSTTVKPGGGGVPPSGASY